MTIESELSTSKLAPESHMEAGQKSAAGNSDSFMISVEPQASHQCSPVLEAKKSKKLALLPLIFLIYFEVAGGPYGEEAAVGAAGPLFAILGFLIFPFIWSIPEALVTAELATTYPGNGGFVLWANAAFGPFWGSLMGTWKFLSGVVNLASYPVLCIDYLKLVFPIFASGVYHHLAIFFFTMILSFLNYTGLTVVGYTSVALGLVSLSPFAVLTVASLPKIQPKRWISLGQKDVKKNWPLFFNTLFWNLNFWDNVSTLAGEVEKPEKTYPKALFSAGIFTCLSYFIPLLAVTGATSLDQSLWVNGYFADAAVTIAGKWLKYWIEVGSVLSAFGLYEAQLTSAFQIVGMSNIRVVPKCLGLRSKWFNTPWVGILLSTLMVLAVSNMNFTNIIASGNILYSLGMLLVFDSFLWLRWKMPKMKRPYRVPLPFWALCIMCLIPSGFLIYIMTVATITVYEVCASLTAFGVMWYFLMKLCKSKKWIKFDNGDAKEENKEETISNLS